jgi:crotonobetainyl-CoA:carnitine CoA-transferase CaiB-like acyl-CoA transferase
MACTSPSVQDTARDAGAASLEALLREVGLPQREPAAAVSCPASPDRHPDLEWARSGVMALTGAPDAPPLLAPAPLASAARAALDALVRLSESPALAGLDAPALLGERAALFGLGRRGAVAPGGSCRLLRAADGWIAVNLARPDDRALLPAWLGPGEVGEPWDFVARQLRRLGAGEAVERARLLGLPVAEAAAPPGRPVSWLRCEARGEARPRAWSDAPLVVDLSSLWAGPLCTHLLALCGARVLKVESLNRPDGARSGAAAFFDLLNAGKPSVALDFGSDAGRATLRRVVQSADVVVESARPRALAQLGIDATELLAERPGLTWLSITGYGRREPEAGWVAFGDDAAVAAGLARATGVPVAPLFCGDAVADPLAGLHAAVAALASFRLGGGHLLDLALRDVVAHWLARPGRSREARVEGEAGGFAATWAGARQAVLGPRARPARGWARPLGADTGPALAEIGVSC